MLRHSTAILSSLLFLTACTPPEGDTGTTECDGLDCTTTTTGPTTTATNMETEESGVTTDDTLTTTTGGDGDDDGSCESDEDCPEDFACVENVCEQICGDVMVSIDVPPPPVMLVLDKSGSMVNNAWDHDGDPGTADETRWATLYTVTDFILTNFESSIKFGLQLFPSTAATTSCANDPACPACDVAATPEVPIAIDNRAAILAAMPAMSADSDSVAGATPAAGGMVNAKAALDDAVANGDTGPAIVLITDGAANCGLQWANEPCEFPGDDTSASCELMDYFDDQLEPLIAGYYANGDPGSVPTYVVGIDIQDVVSDPNSEYNFSVDNTNVFTELNAIAEAGGVPQMGGSSSFYNATNEAELQAALSLIAGELTSCIIELDPQPEVGQIPFVEFFMGGSTEPLAKLDITEAECDAGLEDGWIWVEEGVSVMFCGTACDTLKMTLEVEGIYGCEPIG